MTCQISEIPPELIYWGNTRVWSDGGYCRRLYFNIKGRELNGQLKEAEYDLFRNKLKVELFLDDMIGASLFGGIKYTGPLIKQKEIQF